MLLLDIGPLLVFKSSIRNFRVPTLRVLISRTRRGQPSPSNVGTNVAENVAIQPNHILNGEEGNAVVATQALERLQKKLE